MNLSEIYVSTQGESVHVGLPTIFLRFAGCNLKCPGWPCDSQHAIDPALYRHEWQIRGEEQIFEEIMSLANETGANNVCFTGGEPFLQNNDHLRHLARMLHAESMQMEVFTNGTLLWPDWAIYTFRTITMDWKLAGSGEKIDPLGVPMENAKRLSAKDALKFTVASQEDLQEAMRNWLTFWQFISPKLGSPPVYVGPVWDKIEPAEIVEFVLSNKLPWKLNLQVHKYIWDPDKRRT